MQLLTKNTKTAYTGLMAAVAIVLSYVEVLIPINFGIPGIKLGLANMAALTALYLFEFKEAFLVQLIRIVISGLLFSNMYAILYSLTAGIVSICVMYLIKKCRAFSIISVSISGAVFHNMTQLLVAVFTVRQLKLSFYGPVLIVSGIVMGILIAVISSPVIKHLEIYLNKQTIS